MVSVAEALTAAETVRHIGAAQPVRIVVSCVSASLVGRAERLSLLLVVVSIGIILHFEGSSSQSKGVGNVAHAQTSSSSLVVSTSSSLLTLGILPLSLCGTSELGECGKLSPLVSTQSTIRTCTCHVLRSISVVSDLLLDASAVSALLLVLLRRITSLSVVIHAH